MNRVIERGKIPARFAAGLILAVLSTLTLSAQPAASRAGSGARGSTQRAPKSPSEERKRTEPTPLITLEDALSRAEHTTLARARGRAQARVHDAERESAQTWSNPILQTSVGRIDFQKSSGPTLDVSVEQKLPGTDVRGLKELGARERRTASSIIAHDRELQERVSLIRLLFAYGARHRQNQHVRARLESMSVLRVFLRSRPLLSPSRRVERYIIEGRMQALERQLAQGESDMAALWPRLNVYTQLQGEPRTPHLRWFRGGPDLAFDDLSRRMSTMSPGLRRLRADIRESEVNAALANAARYPAPSVRAFFGGQRSSEPENYYGIAISLPLPFSSQAVLEKRRAIAILKEKRLALRDEERRVHGEFGAAFARYVAASRAVTNLPLSRHEELDDQFTYALTEFRRGRVSADSVLAMDAQADEIHDAIFEAQLALVGAYTELMLLLGDSTFGLADWRLPEFDAKGRH